ncbi:hypothetical protein M434DRAFT_31585 [Hypoxylon sp. CO27-5]|nr:hypothetical protein M434DRAFT_31585 [Hypoxylon sp. CO27-5]
MEKPFTINTFLTILPIFVAAYPTIISLSYSLYLYFSSSPPYLPPSPTHSTPGSPRLPSNADDKVTGEHLSGQHQRDGVPNRTPRPTGTDPVTTYAVFLQPSIRAIIRIVGWLLGDFIPDAEDLVLSTEL